MATGDTGDVYGYGADHMEDAVYSVAVDESLSRALAFDRDAVANIEVSHSREVFAPARDGQTLTW